MSSHDETGLDLRLGALQVAAPSSLVERVVSRWWRADEGPLPVFVAFTPAGVSFVRTVDSVGGELEAFLEEHRRRFGRPARPAERPPAGLAQALRRGRAAGLAFDLDRTSDFARAVLAVTAAIPPGETRPYRWVAREVGRPAAVRAVGTALGRNPVPILIPCHRVTRADGNPGHYAFGAAVKHALLRAEGVDLDGMAELARRGRRYVGNAVTGVACLPTCRHARSIGAGRRRELASAQEAAAAGFRACLSCRPW